MPEPILVSACLLGLRTRYDGSQKLNNKVLEYLRENDYIPVPVCPEQLAGLPTPREEVQFVSGDGNSIIAGNGALATVSGRNLNEIFLRGAIEALQTGRIASCQKALMKERSPSCGVHMIYRAGERVPGVGVTTALLQKENFSVFSEEDL